MSTRTATQTEPTYFFDDLFEDWDAQEEPATRTASSPPAITIVIILALILAVCVGTLIAIGVIAAPAPAADAASSTSAGVIATEADSAALLSGAGIETTVSHLWTESGQTGTVACPAVFSTVPGTLVTCTGVLEGNPLDFTVAITTPSAGHVPFTFASWTAAKKI